MTDNQTIPPIRMIVRPTDFSNAPFGSAFVKQSQAFTVNVQDLPLPLSFSGLVGKFDVSSEVESKEFGVEDYVILTIRVKGNGNVRSIPHIKCPLMDNLREYNSDVFMNFDKKEAVTNGEKLFKFALLPREKGIETIPSVGFSYFDEDQGTYVTKWTDPIEIKIVKKAKKDDAKEEKPKKKTNFMFLFYIVGAVVLGFVGFVFMRSR